MWNSSVLFLQNFLVLEIKSITKLAETTSDLGGMSPSMTMMKFGDHRHYTQSTVSFRIFVCLGCSSSDLVYSWHLWVLDIKNYSTEHAEGETGFQNDNPISWRRGLKKRLNLSLRGQVQIIKRRGKKTPNTRMDCLPCLQASLCSFSGAH